MNRRTLVLYGFAAFAGLLILTGIMEAVDGRWLWALGFWAIGGYGMWSCWREWQGR